MSDLTVLSFCRKNIVVYTLDRLTEDADFSKKNVCDETHFDLGGYVNKQNCRIWGTQHKRCEKLGRNADNIYRVRQIPFFWKMI